MPIRITLLSRLRIAVSFAAGNCSQQKGKGNCETPYWNSRDRPVGPIARGLRENVPEAIFCAPPSAKPSPLHRAFLLLWIMADQDDNELQTELARLQQEHRDLDAAIDALHQSPAPDLLRLQRLKKRKLLLRDRIAFIEDQITPDIIA